MKSCILIVVLALFALPYLAEGLEDASFLETEVPVYTIFSENQSRDQGPIGFRVPLLLRPATHSVHLFFLQADEFEGSIANEDETDVQYPKDMPYVEPVSLHTVFSLPDLARVLLVFFRVAAESLNLSPRGIRNK